MARPGLKERQVRLAEKRAVAEMRKVEELMEQLKQRKREIAAKRAEMDAWARVEELRAKTAEDALARHMAEAAEPSAAAESLWESTVKARKFLGLLFGETYEQAAWDAATEDVQSTFVEAVPKIANMYTAAMGKVEALAAFRERLELYQAVSGGAKPTSLSGYLAAVEGLNSEEVTTLLSAGIRLDEQFMGGKTEKCGYYGSLLYSAIEQYDDEKTMEMCDRQLARLERVAKEFRDEQKSMSVELAEDKAKRDSIIGWTTADDNEQAELALKMYRQKRASEGIMLAAKVNPEDYIFADGEFSTAAEEVLISRKMADPEIADRVRRKFLEMFGGLTETGLSKDERDGMWFFFSDSSGRVAYDDILRLHRSTAPLSEVIVPNPSAGEGGRQWTVREM